MVFIERWSFVQVVVKAGLKYIRLFYRLPAMRLFKDVFCQWLNNLIVFINIFGINELNL